jgi:hypothetical protein
MEANEVELIGSARRANAERTKGTVDRPVRERKPHVRSGSRLVILVGGAQRPKSDMAVLPDDRRLSAQAAEGLALHLCDRAEFRRLDCSDSGAAVQVVEPVAERGPAPLPADLVPKLIEHRQEEEPTVQGNESEVT